MTDITQSIIVSDHIHNVSYLFAVCVVELTSVVHCLYESMSWKSFLASNGY